MVFALVAVILIGSGFLLFRTVRNMVASNEVTVIDHIMRCDVEREQLLRELEKLLEEDDEY